MFAFGTEKTPPAEKAPILDRAFDDRRDTHSESDAQRGQAAVKVLAFHLMQHRGDQTRAAHTQRMAQADCSAIHVELRVLESNRFARRNSHRGESLVDLPQVDVVDPYIGPSEGFPDGWHRAVDRGCWRRLAGPRRPAR